MANDKGFSPNYCFCGSSSPIPPLSSLLLAALWIKSEQLKLSWVNTTRGQYSTHKETYFFGCHMETPNELDSILHFNFSYTSTVSPLVQLFGSLTNSRHFSQLYNSVRQS